MNWLDLTRRITGSRERHQAAREQTQAARKPLAQILNEYQVDNDDKVTNATIFGRDADNKPKSITVTQVNMLIGAFFIDPNLPSRIRAIESQATEESERRYKTPEGKEGVHTHDGHQDAFRHAFGSALTARATSQQWAEDFGSAHEGKEGSADATEAMDLYNNEVGRRIASEHPDASEEELSNLIFQAVENGEMVVINSDGNLAWSNEVEPWEHGTGKGESREPPP